MTDEKRTLTLLIHLTHEEREDIRRRADAMAMKMAQYVRFVLMQAARTEDSN